MITHLKQAVPAQAVAADRARVAATVRGLIADIRQRGDAAVREYSEKFDSWSPESFRLTPDQVEEYIAQVPAQAIEDIRTVQANVGQFARAQRDSLSDFEIKTQPGVFLGQRNIPVGASGAYVPGALSDGGFSTHERRHRQGRGRCHRWRPRTPPIRGVVAGRHGRGNGDGGRRRDLCAGRRTGIGRDGSRHRTIPQMDLLVGPGTCTSRRRNASCTVSRDRPFAGPTEILIIADDTPTRSRPSSRSIS